MTEKLDLSELERLCAAATSPPWCIHPDERNRGYVMSSTQPNGLAIAKCHYSDEDAALIVALRNAAPQMLSRLRALERVAAERDEALRLASKFAQSMIDALRKNQAPPLDIRDTDRLLAMRKEAGL